MQAEPITVTALSNGFYGSKHRKPGESFEIDAPEHFSHRWMTTTSSAVLVGPNFLGTTPEAIRKAIARVDVMIDEINASIERLSYHAVNGDTKARADLVVAKETLQSKLADRADLENAQAGANAAIAEQQERERSAYQAARLAEARAAASELREQAVRVDNLIAHLVDALGQLTKLESTIRTNALQADRGVVGRTGQEGLAGMAVEAVAGALRGGPPPERLTITQYADNAWADLFEGAE